MWGSGMGCGVDGWDVGMRDGMWGEGLDVRIRDRMWG